MRLTFLTMALAALTTFSWGQAASIDWMTIEEAVAAQQKEPRKIVMDVYTKWCGPCKMMMAQTFTNPNVIQYINEHFYAVKFDAESPDPITFQGNTFTNPTYDPNRRGRNGVHEFSRALKVSAYPTLVYFDENAQVIAPISGFKSAAQMELYLTFFNEAYQAGVDQTAWETYRDAFQYTWTN